jgi:hypothetical protein
MEIEKWKQLLEKLNEVEDFIVNHCSDADNGFLEYEGEILDSVDKHITKSQRDVLLVLQTLQGEE